VLVQGVFRGWVAKFQFSPKEINTIERLQNSVKGINFRI